MKIENLEMIPCPKCGRPFPKRRKELGYNYCVNCSTEKPLVSFIEGQGEGEDVSTTVHIVTQKQAFELYKAEHNGKVDINPEFEEAPDLSTFEQQEELTASLSPAEREAYLSELENEFTGMSERSVEELDFINPILGEDEEEDEEFPED